MKNAFLKTILVSALVVVPATTGCERQGESIYGDTALFVPQSTPQPEAPLGLVTGTLGGMNHTFWPYTGSRFDGSPIDPINLVFVGALEPVHIRAALLALDGNRPGLPPDYPFNAPWSEAIGDVQTGYSDPGGWTGSVIQLQLGGYDPVRFHLRLFRAGALPDGRVVTLGAAHFEVLIPGTTEHQVLSWELAEQVVVYDMARTGLLVAPPQPTAPINASPSYREIPDFVYNLLPADLLAAIGGPAAPVNGPVPLPSDGTGTILALGGAVDLPSGPVRQELTIELNQVVPKPFCADGPFDWVLVSGPVRFYREGVTESSGRYEYQAHYEGRLLVLPVDITQDPPRPVGEPFTARVAGEQDGFAWADQSRVQARDTRLAPQDQGVEFQKTLLRVSSQGGSAHTQHSKCLEP